MHKRERVWRQKWECDSGYKQHPFVVRLAAELDIFYGDISENISEIISDVVVKEFTRALQREQALSDREKELSNLDQQEESAKKRLKRSEEELDRQRELQHEYDLKWQAYTKDLEQYLNKH